MNLLNLINPINFKDRLRYIYYRRHYQIDPTFRFNGESIIMTGGGEISIGPRSYIGRVCSVVAVPGTRISIGADCRIGHYVMLYTDSYRVEPYLRGELIKKVGDIIIGDNVWIGTHVYVGPNVKIGEWSIVAAGATVTRDVPPHAVFK